MGSLLSPDRDQSSAQTMTWTERPDGLLHQPIRSIRTIRSGLGDRPHLCVPKDFAKTFSRCGTPKLLRLQSIALTLIAGTSLITLSLGFNAATVQAQVSASSTSSSSARPASATLLFVNPSIGNDRTGDGSQRSPLRTLTQALSVAQPGTTILLASGTYSAETGEQFPIRLKPGITVQGDPSRRGQGVFIRGGGDFVSPTATRQSIAILGADQATLTGVTVTNPNHRGYGVWIESSSPVLIHNTFTDNLHDGVSVNGASAPLIQQNVFQGNGANGVTVFGNSRPRIQQNIFDQTGYGINIGGTSTPVIVSNRISNNRSGVVVQERARPVLRHNVIENNQQSGLAAIAQSQPDLGTADEPGHNQFANNGQHDINAEAADLTLSAVGNQLSESTIIGSVDLTGQTSSLTSLPTQSRLDPIPTESSRETAPLAAPPPSLPTVAIAPLSNPSSSSSPASSPSTLTLPASPPSPSPSTPPTLASPRPIPSSPTRPSPSSSLASPPPPPTRILRTAATAASLAFPRPDHEANASRIGGPGRDALSIDEFISAPSPAASPSGLSPDSSSDLTPGSTASESAESSEPTESVLRRSPRSLSSRASVSPARSESSSRAPSRESASQRSTPDSDASVESDTSADSARPILAPLRTPPSTTPTSASAPSASDAPIDIPVIAPLSSPSSSPSPSLLTAASPAPSSPSSPSPSSSLTLRPAFNRTTPSSAASEATPIRVVMPAEEPARQPRLVLRQPSASTSQPTSQPTSQTSPQTAQPRPNANLLQVPSVEVPYGHVGNRPRISVGTNPLASRISPSASRAQQLGLRYRVLVEANGADDERIVRSIAPGSFRTNLNGRSLMQAGAYASLENANDMARMLASRGLRVEVQQMN